NKRFFNPVNSCGVGHFSRIIYSDLFTFCSVCNKTYVGYSCNYSLIEFTFEPFLDDFHMQQTKKPETKTKPKCLGCFELESKRGIIKLQFFHTITQLSELICIYRKYTGKYHW